MWPFSTLSTIVRVKRRLFVECKETFPSLETSVAGNCNVEAGDCVDHTDASSGGASPRPDRVARVIAYLTVAVILHCSCQKSTCQCADA